MAEISRRVILNAIPAMPTASVCDSEEPAKARKRSKSTIAAGDKIKRACERWLELHEEIDQAHETWRKLEVRLAARHNWFKLDEAARKALPSATPMHELDRRLEKLYDERDALAKLLPGPPTLSLLTIIGKFAVVQQMIEPDDFPKAHAILAHSISDLMRWSQMNGAGPVGVAR